jgi:hypothetical protein
MYVYMCVHTYVYVCIHMCIQINVDIDIDDMYQYKQTNVFKIRCIDVYIYMYIIPIFEASPII